MQKLIDLLTSLKLTVVALAFGMILVFVGTLAQVDQGLYNAQARYFRSFFVFWGPQGASWEIPVFPGGYLVGFVLLVNLVFAQFRRLDFSARSFGLFIVHAGLVILLLGQLLSDVLQVESHMRLAEGESKNYSENSRQVELAITDTSNPDHDQVVTIPESALASQSEIRNPALPFTVRVKKYMPNAQVTEATPPTATNAPLVSRGIGQALRVQAVPPTVNPDERNLPAAVLEFAGAEGASGTWLAALALNQPQPITVQGKQYRFALRPTRYYKPFSIELIKFRHDVYKGTDTPKNFSSQVRLRRPATGEDREVLIYMNNPLRYGGETFYQASYENRQPPVTILQVVRNPGWLTPYIACILVSAGLIIQFMTHLIGFATERRSA